MKKTIVKRKNQIDYLMKTFKKLIGVDNFYKIIFKELLKNIPKDQLYNISYCVRYPMYIPVDAPIIGGIDIK